MTWLADAGAGAVGGAGGSAAGGAACGPGPGEGAAGVRATLRPDRAGAAFSIPYRPRGAGDPEVAGFGVSMEPLGGPAVHFPGELRAAAAFLADIAYGALPLATLARMIGCFTQATGTGRGALTVTVEVQRAGAGPADRQVVELGPRAFEAERTVFGAAHILHEDDLLGLYILEIAPGHAIPAHCHEKMREWELVLDSGLLQQGRPVRRGAAFDWPKGHVHAYRNPTDRPLRVLCIDSPRFDPADEVAIAPAPPLAPLASFAEYPV